MILRSHGQRSLYLAEAMCLGILMASGCGTGTSNSLGKGGGSNTATSATISSGAQLGLVWNTADSTLRSLIGVPGSTQLGPALFPPGTYTAGAFSSSSQTALLIDPKGNLQSMTLPSTQPETVTQNVSLSSVISFSPRGTYATISVPGATSVLIISGLPQTPSANTVSASSAIQGAAISDAGTLLLATNAGSGNVTVSATASNGTRSTLATLAGFGGMSFIPGSEDSLVSDSAGNTLTRYHNGTASVLATHANGLNQPFAVAASQDGHWAVTANRADPTLLRIDLSGLTAPAQSTCACSPTQLSTLGGNAVFELAAPGATPGWMIEADGPTSRVLFIPPVRGGQ